MIKRNDKVDKSGIQQEKEKISTVL